MLRMLARLGFCVSSLGASLLVSRAGMVSVGGEMAGMLLAVVFELMPKTVRLFLGRAGEGMGGGGVCQRKPCRSARVLETSP